MNQRELIAAIQRKAGVEDDGLWGKNTENAVEKWELENGVSIVTGEPKAFPEPTEPTEPTEATNFSTDALRFSQADPSYCENMVGDKSIRRVGCALCSISTAFSMILKRPFSPSFLNEWLRENDGYLGNSVVWGKACECLKETTGVEVQYRRAVEKDSLSSLLEEGAGIICYVYYQGQEDINPDHFVYILEVSESDISFVDPATYPASVSTFSTCTRHGGYVSVRFDAFVPV